MKFKDTKVGDKVYKKWLTREYNKEHKEYENVYNDEWLTVTKVGSMYIYCDGTAYHKDTGERQGCFDSSLRIYLDKEDYEREEKHRKNKALLSLLFRVGVPENLSHKNIQDIIDILRRAGKRDLQKRGVK